MSRCLSEVVVAGSVVEWSCGKGGVHKTSICKSFLPGISVVHIDNHCAIASLCMHSTTAVSLPTNTW